MKRIFTVFMALCMIFCGMIPATATGGETIAQDNLESSSVESSSEENGTMPLSDFTDGGSEFFTKIRLTATDRDSNPVSGAVYGLYSGGDEILIETIETDKSGIALSSDIPVNVDYFLKEISNPEGWLANSGRHEVKLTDVCAPSRVDVGVKYDPIIGRIKVIKTDEDGNPLKDIGFYVYETTDYNQVDDITTDANGEAITKELGYGEYAFYEHNVPDHLAPPYSATATKIEEHGVTVELPITNYFKIGYVKIIKTGSDGKSIAGAVFEVRKSGSDELVEELTTPSTGIVTSNQMSAGNYYVVEKSVPEPYMLDTTQHEFSITTHSKVVSLSIENKVKGSHGKVKIMKTDDNTNPLSGVGFTIYRAWDKKLIETTTTNEDGIALSSDLVPDNYYFVETTGKPGYTADNSEIPFTIDGGGEVVEKSVINPKVRIFGKVKVIKEDDAGQPIKDVLFGVYCNQGNLIEELTTDENGIAISGVLNEGSYYLQELEGVDGYQTDTDQHPFSIVTNEIVVPVTVVNPRITGNVKVLKTGKDGEVLSGVVFGVFRSKDDSEICRLTTSSDGTAVSEPLIYGNYYLKELSTLDGYELLDTPIPFSVMEQDVVTEIPVSNPLIMGNVSVYKTSSDKDSDGNDVPLSGAVFGLYNEKGQKLAEITTDANGQASYSGLPKGKYTVKELQAPEGFVLTDVLLPFSIETQGQTESLTVTNKTGSGTLKVIKTGENGEVLQGVSFDVVHVSTGETAGTITTDSAGEATFSLPLGRYELVETKTADGYVKLPGKISFSLREEGATVEVPVVNRKENQTPDKPKNGTIHLIKTDVKSGALLPGAAFGIYQVSDDTKVGEITTDSNGEATSLPLPAGEYYLTELRAPSGYELSKDKHMATVKIDTVSQLRVSNKALTSPDPEKKNGTVKILKIDAGDNKTPLRGATFMVYDLAGKKVGEMLTGADGTASLELPAGDYTLRESKAPEGYRLSNESISFKLDVGAAHSITVKNSKLDSPAQSGTLRVIKQDSNDSNKKLEGAKFGVFRSGTTTQTETLLTDKNGFAALTLPAGDYFIRELEAPKGYSLKKTDINFKIEQGATRELIVKNTQEDLQEKTGILELIKKEKGGKKQLKNAVFGIYDMDDKKIDELTTGREGTAEIELPVGSYSLKELEAPAGYRLDRKKVDFKITEKKTTKLTIENEKEVAETAGTLRIVKTASDTDKPLPNAVFGIYEDTKKLVELTTNKEGVATHDLPAGSYYLKELKAPAGYQVKSQKKPFEIRKGSKVTVEITNDPENSVLSTGTSSTPPPLSDSKIVIPKTGEKFPILQYTLAGMFFTISSLCGYAIYKQLRTKRNQT